MLYLQGNIKPWHSAQNIVCESCSVMSDSLWPHGQQPTRLLCAWGSPGKSTRVGSHSLLQKIFPTQGSNLDLLHCRCILYHLSHQGSPLAHSRLNQFYPPYSDKSKYCANRYQCCWMNSQNNSTFHLAMNAEHSVFFTIKDVGCCSNSNLLLFHCGAYSKTFHQPPLPQASQLTPSTKAHSLPRSWEGMYTGISGSAPGPFLKHRNTHISMGLVGDKLLLVKWCDVDVNFLKAGCYGKKHHSWSLINKHH